MTRFARIGFLLLIATAGAGAQAPATFNIHVKETAGIRRSGYPAHARVPIPRGALATAADARLVLNGKEAPAQFLSATTWPDGSVQALDVDFNASVGPKEEAVYQLEYGAGVKAEPIARGLSVSETPDAIQVGTVRFSKTAVPLLASVAYRQEDIGPGPNGFAVSDEAGASYDASAADGVKAEIVKRGPLFVVLRYTGQLRIGAEYRVPFTIQVEMPNSKTWWKATATFDDPARRIRSVTFHSPLTFGALPWTWDFGTGSWSYGVFRNKTDSAVFTQVITSPMTGSWTLAAGPKGQEQPYEASAGRRLPVAEGWGHLQDAKEAIAFAIDGFGKLTGHLHHVARRRGAHRPFGSRRHSRRRVTNWPCISTSWPRRCRSARSRARCRCSLRW